MRFTAFEVTIVDDDGSHLFRPDLNKSVSKGTYLSRENAEAAARDCGGMVFPIEENWHPQYPFKDKQKVITDWQTQLEKLRKEYDSMYSAKRNLPRLSLKDHEDVSDNYQFHLEIGYELSALRNEITSLEGKLEALDSFLNKPV